MTPLTDLSKKDGLLVWSPSCKSAFSALKHGVMIAHVLAFPDASELVFDASGFGPGTVLSQTDAPLVTSRGMTAAERNYTVIRQELLITVEA